MSEEIKPCPFCGSDTEVFFYEIGYAYIECLNDECMAMGPDGNTKEEAIQKWNQRPYDYDMPAIVKKVQRMEAALVSAKAIIIKELENYPFTQEKRKELLCAWK